MKKIFISAVRFLIQNILSIIIIAFLIYQFFIIKEQNELIRNMEVELSQVHNSISGTSDFNFSLTSESVKEKLDNIEFEILNLEDKMNSIQSDVMFLKYR